MPYVDGESDEEDFIYEQQMIGHDSKRVKEDDESYEEEDGVRRRKDHSLLPDGTIRPREEGPIM